MARTRTAPNVVARIPSPNCSRRLVSRPSMIVVHSTEGANIAGPGDLITLGRIFRDTVNPRSCHVATDADGNSGVYVPGAMKAWHVAAYNSMALGIEQVGFASQDRWPERQLKETARWIALWSVKYGIPIRHGAPGVMRHSDLGTAGGGHHDPGPNYPLDEVLRYATVYRRRRLLHIA